MNTAKVFSSGTLFRQNSRSSIREVFLSSILTNEPLLVKFNWDIACLSSQAIAVCKGSKVIGSGHPWWLESSETCEFNNAMYAISNFNHTRVT
jgi:hypothetical protein